METKYLRKHGIRAERFPDLQAGLEMKGLANSRATRLLKRAEEEGGWTLYVVDHLGDVPMTEDVTSRRPGGRAYRPLTSREGSPLLFSWGERQKGFVPHPPRVGVVNLSRYWFILKPLPMDDTVPAYLDLLTGQEIEFLLIEGSASSFDRSEVYLHSAMKKWREEWRRKEEVIKDYWRRGGK